MTSAERSLTCGCPGDPPLVLQTNYSSCLLESLLLELNGTSGSLSPSASQERFNPHGLQIDIPCHHVPGAKLGQRWIVMG